MPPHFLDCQYRQSGLLFVKIRVEYVSIPNLRFGCWMLQFGSKFVASGSTSTFRRGSSFFLNCHNIQGYLWEVESTWSRHGQGSSGTLPCVTKPIQPQGVNLQNMELIVDRSVAGPRFTPSCTLVTGNTNIIFNCWQAIIVEYRWAGVISPKISQRAVPNIFTLNNFLPPLMRYLDLNLFLP